MTAISYRVLCMSGDPEWQEHRSGLVTGTVAPSLLGVQRFGSLLGHYARMRGEYVEEPSAETEARWQWGHDQEESVIRNVAGRLGLKARKANVLLQSVEWPWMGCTLDAWIEVDGSEVPFEIKTTAARGASDKWEDGAPADVVAQVQQQMLVTGADRCLVAVVLFGQPPLYTWVDRDDEMIERLVVEGRKLSDMVANGTPPAPDGSDDAGVVLSARKRDAGSTIDLDIDAANLVLLLDEAEAASKAASAEVKRLKQELIVELMDSETGLLPGGGRVTFKEQRRAGSVKVQGISLAEVSEALSAIPGLKFKASETKESRFRVLRRKK